MVKTLNLILKIQSNPQPRFQMYIWNKVQRLDGCGLENLLKKINFFKLKV